MSKYVFTELTDKEFTNFVEKSEQRTFLQTTIMNNYYKLKGKETHLIGVKENKNVVGAALVYLQSTYKNYNKFDIYRGFVLDYNNKELLEFMIEETINYLKGLNAYCFTIDPYIIQVERDTDANVIPDAKDNFEVVKHLKELGFVKSKEDVQQKWLYVIDIDERTSDELFKNIKSSTRNKINRTTNKYHLDIKTLKYEELEEFQKILHETSSRRGFADKPLLYYQNMMKAFEDQVTFKVVELNCPKYLKALEEEKEDYTNRIKTATAKKDELQKELDTINSAIDEVVSLQKDKGDIIPLACGMFILYGDEVIYLLGGSYQEYMQYCAQYLIQWEMIKYACDNNYKIYNFYGIMDVFNPKSKNYGVYEFKKRFNGHVKEILGEYTYIINKSVNNKLKLRRLIKKIIKK